ncbi:MAG: von Willebrand factor type A domain-containing protein [Clostridia bacterium]|nr:von Willebrand factor type A domain-containing protein [Clostridia bacterium]
MKKTGLIIKKIKLSAILLCVSFAVFAACSTGNNAWVGGGLYAPDALEGLGFYDRLNDETYSVINELPFVKTEDAAESYFSMDSHTAAYSNLRRMINNGQVINRNAIRTDEMLNYFSYSIPDSGETFSSVAKLTVAPWNSENYFLSVGVRTRKTTIERYSQGNNFVFLIDVSGSMSGENRLGLVKKSFLMLLDNLNETDKISIVTYANGVRTICSGVNAGNRSALEKKINALVASGGTNGAGGIQAAYAAAERNFIPGGNNRVLIATDGDFNVGLSSVDELKEFIQEKAETGVYLTCLGYGMGNYRDDMLETLARNGNGNFAYIDSLSEAKKVLVDEMDNALCVVAKDVKSEITFNEDVVDSYRLIGYENKTITKEDFENELTDAGELGSNTTAMVCYEIKLKQGAYPESVASIRIKYKDPLTEENLEYSKSFVGIYSDIAQAGEDHRFAAAVVEFSLVIRNSAYMANASLRNVIETLDSLGCCSTNEYKAEFKELVVKVSKSDLIEKRE